MSSASRGLAPREGLGCLVDEDGPYGRLAQPHCGLQAGKSGDPSSRMPTVAPGPKVRPGLPSRRSQRSSVERRGPQKPAALVDAWRLIRRGRLRFLTLSQYPPG